jgi:hypothetical protein
MRTDPGTTLESERLDHEAMRKGELPGVSWEKIIEHIDHAVAGARDDYTEADCRRFSAATCSA